MKELFNKYDWETWGLSLENALKKSYEEELELWADTLSYLFLFSRKMAFNIKSQLRKNEEELLNTDISEDYLKSMKFYIQTLEEELRKVDSVMEDILGSAGLFDTYFYGDVRKAVQIAHNRIQTMEWHK